MSQTAWHDMQSREDVVLARPCVMTARTIFQQYVPFVWRTLRCHNVAARDLEDVAQEVFLVVLRKLPTYEERGTLRGWLYRICLRAASTYRRRARVRREVLVHEVPEPPPAALVGAEIERFHAFEQLMALLATLDEEKRAVFALHEIEQIPMAEVAALVGCPTATAYSRLAAAKRQLVKRLAARAGDDE